MEFFEMKFDESFVAPTETAVGKSCVQMPSTLSDYEKNGACDLNPQSVNLRAVAQPRKLQPQALTKQGFSKKVTKF